MNTNDINKTEESIKKAISAFDNPDHFFKLQQDLESEFDKVEKKNNRFSIFNLNYAFALVIVVAFSLSLPWIFGQFQESKSPISANKYELKLSSITNSPQTPKVFMGVTLDSISKNVFASEISNCYVSCKEKEKIAKAIENMNSLNSYKITSKSYNDPKDTITEIVYLSVIDDWQRYQNISGKSGDISENIITANTYFEREKTGKSWSDWMSQPISIDINNPLDTLNPSAILKAELIGSDISSSFESNESTNEIIKFSVEGYVYNVTITPSLTIPQIVITEDGKEIMNIIYTDFDKPMGTVAPKFLVEPQFPSDAKTTLLNTISKLKIIDPNSDSYRAIYKNTLETDYNIIFANKIAPEHNSGKETSHYSYKKKDTDSEIKVINGIQYLRTKQNDSELWSNWTENKEISLNKLDQKELLSFLLSDDAISKISSIKISDSYTDQFKTLSFEFEDNKERYSVIIDINSSFEIISLKVDTYSESKYVNTVQVAYFPYDSELQFESPQDESKYKFMQF